MRPKPLDLDGTIDETYPNHQPKAVPQDVEDDAAIPNDTGVSVDLFELLKGVEILFFELMVPFVKGIGSIGIPLGVCQ